MADEKKKAAPKSQGAAIKAKKILKKPSVLKRIRQEKRKKAHNDSKKSHLKSLVKKIREAISEKNKEKSSALYKLLSGAADRAALKNIITRNKASRYKSRIAKQIKKI